MSRTNRTVGAESSRKLLNALLSFDDSHPSWTVPGLASHLGVPQSTMYRYIALLREVGLVDTSGGGEYRLTERVVGLARGVTAARATLLDVARPHLIGLRDATDETVLLARRGGAFGYCVDRVDSRRPVRLPIDGAQAMALHANAAVRVLLAAMPRGERDALVGDIAARLPEDRRAQVSPPALDAIRKAGWTECVDDADADIWGVAAAVMQRGEVVASLGVTGPVFRLDDARRADISAQVRAAAATISANLP